MPNHRIKGLLFHHKKKKQNVILASIFNFISVHRFVQFSHSCSFCIRRYSPCCKPQDTTVYYGLVFARWNNNAPVNSICAPPPPRADLRALDFFFPLDGKFPGVGWVPRPPSTLQHFSLIVQSNSAVLNILICDFLF